MPRFQFHLCSAEEVRQAGVVESESFTMALDAVSRRIPASPGDTLEIGVGGFPPARYECISPIPDARRWRPAGLLAA